MNYKISMTSYCKETQITLFSNSKGLSFLTRHLLKASDLVRDL